MNKLLLLVCISLIIIGCEAQKAEQLPQEPVGLDIDGTERFSVTKFGSFNAGVNDNRRDILIVYDTLTDRRFLAVTGCGVSELIDEVETSVIVDTDGNPHIQTNVVEVEE